MCQAEQADAEVAYRPAQILKQFRRGAIPVIVFSMCILCGGLIASRAEGVG